MLRSAYCVSALLIVCTTAAAESYRYEVIPPGVLPGTVASEAADINDSGIATGTSWQANHYRAFRTTPDGELEDLGTLPAPFNWGSFGLAINSNGQVAGTSLGPGIPPRAFRYTPGEGMIDLGSLGGGTAEPTAINDAGNVVGSSARQGESSWQTHPFLYTDEQGMVDLAPGSAGVMDGAADINNLDQVVGVANGQGFLWSPEDGLVSLGDVRPAAINDDSVIVGYRQTENLEREAIALYDDAEIIVELGTLPGFHQSAALDINDAGQVLGVGFLIEEYVTVRYFIWTPETGPVGIDELTDALEGTLGEFHAINHVGQMTSQAGILNPILQADLDFDADVDRADFGYFQRCVGGADAPAPPACPPGILADLDLDHDVDTLDFEIFLDSFTAPR